MFSARWREQSPAGKRFVNSVLQISQECLATFRGIEQRRSKDLSVFPHSRECKHSVLFYRDEETLRDRVLAHVAAALRDGEPALIIAKPGLREALAIELHRQHVQGKPFGPRRGSLSWLDAGATLDQFCIGGRVDATRFHEVVGGALARLSHGGTRVTAYGEMVGLLCEQGHYAEAMTLEALWNELLASTHTSLCCGYAEQLFESAAGRVYKNEIRALHSHAYEGAAAA
jgi:hypothetical protein